MDDARERLLDALAEAIEAVGWEKVTTAEVARRARTSKRTFYEHFPSKSDGFLALYELEAAKLVARVGAALQSAPSEKRIEEGVAAYLGGLAERPGLARTMLLEVVRLGAPGIALRRRVLGLFADVLATQAAPERLSAAQTSLLARVLVGGINELVLETVEADGAEGLQALQDDVVAILDLLADALG